MTDHSNTPIFGMLVTGISGVWTFIGENHNEIAALCCIAGVVMQILTYMKRREER